MLYMKTIIFTENETKSESDESESDEEPENNRDTEKAESVGGYSESLFARPKMGFIITRHVINRDTNVYWNFAIQSIRRYYKNIPVVVIDDNSNKEHIRCFNDYENVRIIESQFKGRGELLPYIYLLSHQFFENALIMHDSVFIHRHINFNKLIKQNIKALPLWYFNADRENIERRIQIASKLHNYHLLNNDLELQDATINTFRQNTWQGWFGVQGFISLKFLIYIQNKYRITNLIPVVKTRGDRQCLERILGCIFSREFKVKDKRGIRKSLLGNIMRYQRWGYTLNNYIHDLKNDQITIPCVKIWTGR